MTLDQIKLIAAARTKGEWDEYKLRELFDVSIPFNIDSRRSAKFIKMCHDNIDKLIAIAEAAKNAIANEGWYSENVSLALFTLESDK